MTLDQAFENQDFIEALNNYNFVKAFSFLNTAEERSKLFLLLQEEGYNPLTGFIEIPSNFLSQFPITKIKIPNSVTSIGSSAFEGCSSLTSITIPDSITSIGSYAFRDCSGLMSVKIGASVMMISEAAFMSCSGLTSIEIPNSVINIGDYAFNSCHGLINVVIPDIVTSIGEHAFAWCNNLKEINFKGTKKQAMKLGIGSKSRKTWRHGSAIERIICIDGVIRLR